MFLLVCLLCGFKRLFVFRCVNSIPFCFAYLAPTPVFLIIISKWKFCFHLLFIAFRTHFRGRHLMKRDITSLNAPGRFRTCDFEVPNESRCKHLF